MEPMYYIGLDVHKRKISFAAAWSPIISRTTLIPASLFVMIESSCKAQVTSPPQYYSNGSRTHKYRKTR